MVSTNVSQTAHDKIAAIGKKARAASLIMAKASSKQKNDVLLTLADLLGKNLEDLLKANNLDIVEAEKNGLSKAFIDRLTITVDTVAQMAAGLRQIASLRDPIGEITDVRPQPSGIEVGKMRVPLGVVAIIYESRPNVTCKKRTLSDACRRTHAPGQNFLKLSEFLPHRNSGRDTQVAEQKSVRVTLRSGR